MPGPLKDPGALGRTEYLDAIPVATLVVSRFVLLQVLVLPQGFIAVFSGDSLDMVYDTAGRVLLPPTRAGNIVMRA